MAQALAGAWGVLVWANWYRWNATGPDADWVAFTRSAFALIPYLAPGSFIRAWAGHAGSFAGLGLLGVGAFGVGSAALAWLGLRRSRSVRRLVEAVTLGMALGGFVAMGWGLAGLSFPLVATAGSVIAAGLGIRGLWVWRGWVAGLPGFVQGMPDRRFVIIGLVVVGFSLLVPLCGAVAPETSIDAQLHHLGQPAFFMAIHRVVALPWNEFSWHPALAHMSILHALQCGGLPVAKLVSYGWFVLLVVLVVDWSRRYLSTGWALLVGAGFALLPYIQLLAMRAYPDFATVLFTAIMMRGLAESSSLRLTGLWAGLAAATKITGVLAPAVGVAGLVLARAGLRVWLWSAVLSLAAVVPWCLRNLLASGNPFAPLVPGVIPTLGWDPESVARHLRDFDDLRGEPMALPGVFALLERAWNTCVRNTGVMDPMAGTGGWFLWLLPLVLLVPPGPAVSRSGWLLVAGLVVWHSMPRLVRYSMPLWPAATVMAAVVIRSLVASGGSGRLIAGFGVVVLAFQVPLGIARQHHVANPVGVACGAEPADRYLARGFPEGARTLVIRDWIAAQRGNSRVLMVTPAGLWLTYGPGVVLQSLFDRPVIVRLAAESRSSGEIAKRLRQLRVGLFLYQPLAGMALHRKYRTWEFDDPAAARWRAFWEARAVPVFASSDRFAAFRIAASDSPAGPLPGGVLPGLDELWLADEFHGDPVRLAPVAERRNTAAAWELLGAARLNRGDEAGALAAFTKSAALGRRSVATLSAVGFLSARAGRWGPAERALREALVVDPDRTDVRATLDRVLAARQQKNKP